MVNLFSSSIPFGRAFFDVSSERKTGLLGDPLRWSHLLFNGKLNKEYFYLSKEKKKFFMKKIDSQNTVFLVDGSSFLYRAYYSMRPLHSPSGEPVHAVYVFCRMIKKLLDQFDPSFLAVVWDSKGKTARHEMYPAYKATRQAPPSDLFQQKERILSFGKLVGLPQLWQEGVEADDLLYALAKKMQQAGKEIVIISSDKDLCQIISEQICIFDPFKNAFVDRFAFEEKMGFAVEKLPFYFSLLGDASDNIPGVKSIGKKTAAELVLQFASLEDLYENLHQLKSEKQRKALEEQKENAFLSYQLFLLRDYEVQLTEADLAFNQKQLDQAQPFFQELGFSSLVTGERGSAQEPVSNIPLISDSEKYTFKAITTAESLDELCAYLKKKKAFALDVETTGLRPLEHELVGISVCADDQVAYYIPVAHKTDEPQLAREQVLSKLKPLFEDSSLEKYFHNAKYDRLVLGNAEVVADLFSSSGIEVAGYAFDTLLAASLVTEEGQRIGLKYLSESIFNERMLRYSDIVKKGSYPDFSYVPISLATTYAAADALQTFRLFKLFKGKLAEHKLEQLYYDIELPVSSVLCDMEKCGIGIDTGIIEQLNKRVSQELETIIGKINAYIDKPDYTLNLNSPKQIEELLFNILRLPPQKKSNKKTGYSTDQEVLQTLAKINPVPAMILQYRSLQKLKSGYLDALPTYINPKTQKIHTTFSQTTAATGRLSSYEPNLQNIPLSSVYGREIRSAFIPDSGYQFISADYSQIELRVLAFLSQDANLIQAFLENRDIHRETSSRLFGVALDQVTDEQRQIGKRINFSILYGLTPYGLAKDLDISHGDAKQYIERYFEQYPSVGPWMESIIAFAKEHGYVQTLWGRRRYVPGIYEKNASLYNLARRIAINTVAQGTAAEIMKRGMVNLYEKLKTEFGDAKILIQIHDELLLSVPQGKEQAVGDCVRHILEHVVDWNVPLTVTIRSGESWGDVSK